MGVKKAFPFIKRNAPEAIIPAESHLAALKIAIAQIADERREVAGATKIFLFVDLDGVFFNINIQVCGQTFAYDFSLDEKDTERREQATIARSRCEAQRTILSNNHLDTFVSSLLNISLPARVEIIPVIVWPAIHEAPEEIAWKEPESASRKRKVALRKEQFVASLEARAAVSAAFNQARAEGLPKKRLKKPAVGPMRSSAYLLTAPTFFAPRGDLTVFAWSEKERVLQSQGRVDIRADSDVDSAIGHLVDMVRDLGQVSLPLVKDSDYIFARSIESYRYLLCWTPRLKYFVLDREKLLGRLDYQHPASLQYSAVVAGCDATGNGIDGFGLQKLFKLGADGATLESYLESAGLPSQLPQLRLLKMGLTIMSTGRGPPEAVVRQAWEDAGFDWQQITSTEPRRALPMRSTAGQLRLPRDRGQRDRQMRPRAGIPVPSERTLLLREGRIADNDRVQALPPPAQKAIQRSISQKPTEVHITRVEISPDELRAPEASKGKRQSSSQKRRAAKFTEARERAQAPRVRIASAASLRYKQREARESMQAEGDDDSETELSDAFAEGAMDVLEPLGDEIHAVREEVIADIDTLQSKLVEEAEAALADENVEEDAEAEEGNKASASRREGWKTFAFSTSAPRPLHQFCRRILPDHPSPLPQILGVGTIVVRRMAWVLFKRYNRLVHAYMDSSLSELRESVLPHPNELQKKLVALTLCSRKVSNEVATLTAEAREEAVSWIGRTYEPLGFKRRQILRLHDLPLQRARALQGEDAVLHLDQVVIEVLNGTCFEVTMPQLPRFATLAWRLVKKYTVALYASNKAKIMQTMRSSVEKTLAGELALFDIATGRKTHLKHLTNACLSTILKEPIQAGGRRAGEAIVSPAFDKEVSYTSQAISESPFRLEEQERLRERLYSTLAQIIRLRDDLMIGVTSTSKQPTLQQVLTGSKLTPHHCMTWHHQMLRHISDDASSGLQVISDVDSGFFFLDLNVFLTWVTHGPTLLQSAFEWLTKIGLVTDLPGPLRSLFLVSDGCTTLSPVYVTAYRQYQEEFMKRLDPSPQTSRRGPPPNLHSLVSKGTGLGFFDLAFKTHLLAKGRFVTGSLVCDGSNLILSARRADRCADPEEGQAQVRKHFIARVGSHAPMLVPQMHAKVRIAILPMI